MQGQTSLFPKDRNTNRIDVRIDRDIKHEAQEKARNEGYSLSYLIKCFVVGYLAGDFVASEIVANRNKK